MRNIGAQTIIALCLAGCASTEPYQPRQRSFDPGPYGPQAAKPAASLAPIGGRSLLEDERATGIGDVLIVRVDEADSAFQDSSTRLSRESGVRFGISGALEGLSEDVDLRNLFGAEAASDFDGGGRIQRRGGLQATLPVRVRQVLPNGDLFVEGSKRVQVGNEERRLYLSGVVRPMDIRADGSVFSSRIADAEIEYAGAGDATDQQQPGWLSRVLTSLWPF
jgi:flagellar L-ring protein precursor FlgH